MAPTVDELEYQRASLEAFEVALENDPILTASSSKSLERTVLELAKEQAALRFERQRLQGKGSDIGIVSSRRIDALGRLANVIVATNKAGLYGRDPSPKRLEEIRDEWLVAIERVARETLPEETATTFIDRYRATLAKVDVLNVMRGEASDRP